MKTEINMKTWDEYWKDYKMSPAEQWLAEERHNVISRYLEKIKTRPARVLEVGCGAGTNIRSVRGFCPGTECFALDNSRVAIEKIRSDIAGAVLADCAATPFPDQHFDLIFSAGLMEHFPDEGPFLKEMRRILKDKGYLLTFVPGKYSLWQVYRWLHFGRWTHGFEKAYGNGGLRDLFEKNGFLTVETSGLDPFSLFGSLMKLSGKKFRPPFHRSFLPSAYTEVWTAAQKS
jgi:SAM-dependent methyltransferase